jgi:hypothetical protein
MARETGPHVLGDWASPDNLLAHSTPCLFPVLRVTFYRPVLLRFGGRSGQKSRG